MSSPALLKKLQRRKEHEIDTVLSAQSALARLAEDPEATEEIVIWLDTLTDSLRTMIEIRDELLEHDVDLKNELRSFREDVLQLQGKLKTLAKQRITPSTDNGSTITNAGAKPKLPTIEIPKFDGSLERWQEFHDSFQSLIISNAGMADVEKLIYLRTSLTGEAFNAIKCITTSHEGFGLAWSELETRYNDKHAIIRRHVRELFALSPAKKDCYSSLRNMIDQLRALLAALRSLQLQVDIWAPLIAQLACEKVDRKTQQAWDERCYRKTPTLQEIMEFLEERCRLQRFATSAVPANVPAASLPRARALSVSDKPPRPPRQCSLCDQTHALWSCPVFEAKPVSERRKHVHQLRVCFRCMKAGHHRAQCRIRTTCNQCNGAHHAMLHLDEQPYHEAGPGTTPIATVASVGVREGMVLMPTCVILADDANGQPCEIRALLDSGAEINLISEPCVRRLGLRTQHSQMKMSVAGGQSASTSKTAQILVRSRLTNFSVNLRAHVLKQITGPVPSQVVSPACIDLPENLHLADPTFNQPAKIDLLIGSGALYSLMLDGRITAGKIVMQNTVFGWLIVGETAAPSPIETPPRAVLHVRLDEILLKFWETESHLPPVDAAPNRSEAHFAETASRGVDGRFIVALPFKRSVNELGNSSRSARQAFLSLERRLQRFPEKYRQYREFMSEYLQLGHMLPSIGDVHAGYYLPHHCVTKEESLTTKLRVVFNGSASSTTGVSLNDLLTVGPKLQDDLFDILIRFRCRKYVLSADVTKMYRQVWVQPADRKYQRIWWRNSPAEELRSYELATLTYGTACASYLAIKALQENAKASATRFPRAAQACLSDFYVDDLFTGADKIDDLLSIRRDVEAILSVGGMNLSKWASNCPEVLADVADTHQNDKVIIQEATSVVSALGIRWHPARDHMVYQLDENLGTPSTKREVLSRVCRIFDPLGLVGPIVVKAKIFIQHLWRLNVGWDDALSKECTAHWQTLHQDLDDVGGIQIPRCVMVESHIELQGFADASELAYGACIYAVSLRHGVRMASQLICAKSRVAPVKQLSIPRLELAAALLLAELMDRVRSALQASIVGRRYYSDSQIVLSWIKADARNYKVFIANRIGEIQRLTDPNQWYHIAGTSNPADLISRGIGGAELRASTLWWHGPAEVLQEAELISLDMTEPAIERKNCLTARVEVQDFQRYSSFLRCIRVRAYVLRFVSLLRGDKPRGAITASEIQHAKTAVIKDLQSSSLSNELQQAAAGEACSKKSGILSLSPFIGTDGLLRVGGRLSLAENLSSAQRNPIILPRSHPLTKLIVRDIHERALHAGVQGTLAAIRQEYWPIRGQNIVKEIIRNCVRCTRAQPIPNQPQMGLLPDIRLQPCRPFLHCGVDYAGPFNLKVGDRKSKRCHKGYISVFCCFATKAVHLELVSDLTTEAFLAAFERLFSRRGVPARMYSDNGTNFQGAANKLRGLGMFLREQEQHGELQASLATKGIDWCFIPPRAPHFGGLWEAAVKSCKHHLRRVAGNAMLTFEEMYTLLTRIEAVLNSRPMTPLSDDPNDFEALTPGHFLIGEPLTTLPTQGILNMPENRLSRWKLLERMRQDVWKRWQLEYISMLHQRNKWRKPATPLAVGQLVIIREDNAPPLQWQLGRIVQVQPGRDGIIRSANVQTESGKIERLCALLPSN